ncbi:hypothetical protein [Chryseobacterium wanjuense]
MSTQFTTAKDCPYQGLEKVFLDTRQLILKLSLLSVSYQFRTIKNLYEHDF